MSSKLPSEKVVVSAPFSFIGSEQRIWKITHVDNLLAKILLVPLALVLIMGAWVFVACWYFIMYVLFGVFFFLYRLLRRGGRKRKQEKLRNREVLKVIEHQRHL